MPATSPGSPIAPGACCSPPTRRPGSTAAAAGRLGRAGQRRAPAPRPMTEDRLRHVLAQLVNWRKRAPNGDLVPAYPPPVLLKNLLATPDPALPVLAGIVTAPVFGSDGTLITEPGYHPAARLLYEPTPSFTLPPIPERPTPATDRGRAFAAARRPARRLPVRRRRRAGACAGAPAAPLRAADDLRARRRCIWSRSRPPAPAPR